MPTTSNDARLTYRDFLLLPDDGRRHELIDGAHYVTPSPNLNHQELVLRLALSLGHHLEDRLDRGRLFIAPLDVVFSFHDVVEPDLVIVAPDQLDILTDQNIQARRRWSSRSCPLPHGNATWESSAGSTTAAVSGSIGWWIPQRRA